MSVLPESPAGWIGYGIAALVASLSWLKDRRKNDIDESAVVLTKWKELVDTHMSDIIALKAEFASYKVTATEEFTAYKQGALAEITDLRDRLRKAEKRIGELEMENHGLMRAIGQNSKTTAYQLGGQKPAPEDIEIERAIHKLNELPKEPHDGE